MVQSHNFAWYGLPLPIKGGGGGGGEGTWVFGVHPSHRLCHPPTTRSVFSKAKAIHFPFQMQEMQPPGRS